MSLRYVILRHEDIEKPHFDLMFETVEGSELLTWRAMRWPTIIGDVLEKLGDHRREYLEYEGALSRKRGTVRRIQSGEFDLMKNQHQIFEGTIDGQKFAFLKDDSGVWKSA